MLSWHALHGMTTQGFPPGIASRSGRWSYALASLAFLTFYLTAFLAGGIPLGLAVRGAVANALPETLLGLWLLRIPARLRPPDGGKHRFFAAHAALAAAFIFAASAGWFVLYALDHRIFEGGWMPPGALRFVGWRSFNDLLIYCALMGLGYAAQSAAARRELAERASRAEALRARAELEVLRSQLHPHFILNTFHALIGLVRSDAALAEEALEKLGDLLRYSLRIQREGRDEVTLRDEWAFVSTYLDLERLRLGDRLQVRFEAEDGLLDQSLPSLGLQTLVENAVHHAVEPRADGGRIDIRVRRTDGCLRIEVEDDGRLGSAPAPEESNGVGLPLLRERLAALYDGRARLALEVGAAGTCAALEVPLDPGEEEG